MARGFHRLSLVCGRDRYRLPLDASTCSGSISSRSWRSSRASDVRLQQLIKLCLDRLHVPILRAMDDSVMHSASTVNAPCPSENP
jgi:hypothetical protein